MSLPARIYDADILMKIAKFCRGLHDLQKELEGEIGGFPTDKNPLYLFNVEIVIRHKDNYTVGRIGMDDFMFFEITDEDYGETTKDPV